MESVFNEIAKVHTTFSFFLNLGLHCYIVLIVIIVIIVIILMIIVIIVMITYSFFLSETDVVKAVSKELSLLGLEVCQMSNVIIVPFCIVLCCVVLC